MHYKIFGTINNIREYLLSTVGSNIALCKIHAIISTLLHTGSKSANCFQGNAYLSKDPLSGDDVPKCGLFSRPSEKWLTEMDRIYGASTSNFPESEKNALTAIGSTVSGRVNSRFSSLVDVRDPILSSFRAVITNFLSTVFTFKSSGLKSSMSISTRYFLSRSIILCGDPDPLRVSYFEVDECDDTLDCGENDRWTLFDVVD